MLEGNEVEKKIGEVGTLVIDVTDKGVATVSIEVAKEAEGVKGKVSASVEVSAVTLIEKLVAATKTKVDDAIVAQIKLLLGL